MTRLYLESINTGNPPSEFVEDDLPLPSFLEVFGFTVHPNQARLQAAPVPNIRKRLLESSNSLTAGTLAAARTQQLGQQYVKALGKRLKVIETNDNGEPVRQETGRWTPEEHKLFLEGVMLYGKDWKKMQALIKTRSLIQIRTHAQKVFKKIGIQSAKKTDSLPGNNKGRNAASCQVQEESEYVVGVAMESGSYRNYDMGEEVTDEEFNLVVQHLKSLGEMRGDDLNEEEEEAEDQQPPFQLQSQSLDHPSSSALGVGSSNSEVTLPYHITDYDPRHSLLSARGLDTTVVHMAYNNASSSSPYRPAQGNCSIHNNYLQDYSMRDTTDQDSWANKELQAQQQESHQQQDLDQQLQEHNFSPSVTEEELHNHQLLQTLRQLMPDNFDQYSAISTDFRHARYGALDSHNIIGRNKILK